MLFMINNDAAFCIFFAFLFESSLMLAVHMARAGPWKVLEVEMSFRGHLKLLENENFSLKIDQAL